MEIHYFLKSNGIWRKFSHESSKRHFSSSETGTINGSGLIHKEFLTFDIYETIEAGLASKIFYIFMIN